MESRVKSHISNKTYSTQLEKIEEEDIDAKTECYRLPISGHDIMVAPGKSIMENGIAYCYVYAIQSGKVTCKLGVYEKKTETMPIFFDLTTFPEGAFCLFEEFEKNPSKLVDLQMVPETGNLNIFDYLKEDLYPKIDNPKSRLNLAYKTLFEIYSPLKKTNEKDAKEMVPIMKIIKEASDKGTFLSTLKEKAQDKTTLVLTLLALQHVFLVKFNFRNESERHQELISFWPVKDPTTTIEVDVNTFEKVEEEVEEVDQEDVPQQVVQPVAMEETKEEDEVEESDPGLDMNDEDAESEKASEEEAENPEIDLNVEDEPDPVISNPSTGSLSLNEPLGTSLNALLPTDKTSIKSSIKKPKKEPKSKAAISSKKESKPLGTSLNNNLVNAPEELKIEPITEETSVNLAQEMQSKNATNSDKPVKASRKSTPKSDTAVKASRKTTPKSDTAVKASRKTTPKSDTAVKASRKTTPKSDTAVKASRKTTPKSDTAVSESANIQEPVKTKIKTVRRISEVKKGNSKS